MKQHAFASLLATALIATTRFVLAALRWYHARSSELNRTAWFAASTKAHARYRFPLFALPSPFLRP